MTYAWIDMSKNRVFIYLLFIYFIQIKILGMTYAWVDMSRKKMVRIHVTLQLATIAPWQSQSLNAKVKVGK